MSVTAEVTGVWPVALPTAVVRLEPAALPGDVNPPATPAEVQDSFLAVPWSQLAVIVLIVAALLVFRWLRRRRAAPSPVAGEQKVKVPA